jgi:hypothetical protein
VESSGAGTTTSGNTPSNSGDSDNTGRLLLLPDISLIGNLVGHLSNDKRDGERDKLRLDEVEIGIQSFVYPGIRADAFFVFGRRRGDRGRRILDRSKHWSGQSAAVGHGGAAQGAVRSRNQLHPHSWPYIVQPYVLSNLVSGESLTGDGATYLICCRRADCSRSLDAWFLEPYRSRPKTSTHRPIRRRIRYVAGRGLGRQVSDAALWTAAETLGGSLELGGSLARGRGVGGFTPRRSEDGGDGSAASRFAATCPLCLSSRQVGFLPGATHDPTFRPGSTYRGPGRGASRLLLRGEYVRHRLERATSARPPTAIT